MVHEGKQNISRRFSDFCCWRYSSPDPFIRGGYVGPKTPVDAWIRGWHRTPYALFFLLMYTCATV